MPVPLWEPTPEACAGTNLARFTDWLAAERGLNFDLADLHRLADAEENRRFGFGRHLLHVLRPSHFRPSSRCI